MRIKFDFSKLKYFILKLFSIAMNRKICTAKIYLKESGLTNIKREKGFFIY